MPDAQAAARRIAAFPALSGLYAVKAVHRVIARPLGRSNPAAAPLAPPWIAAPPSGGSR
jgi:hypothetical protein